MVWEHPVSLVLVYVGFYLAIVFISLSIGEWAHGKLSAHPDSQPCCSPARIYACLAAGRTPFVDGRALLLPPPPPVLLRH
jgi:hypothetical protein